MCALCMLNFFLFLSRHPFFALESATAALLFLSFFSEATSSIKMVKMLQIFARLLPIRFFKGKQTASSLFAITSLFYIIACKAAWFNESLTKWLICWCLL